MLRRVAAGLLLPILAAPASAGLPLPTPPKLDAHGHPLPPGAVARLGDHARRHGDASLFTFSPDGRLVARCRTVGNDIRESATGRDVTPAWARRLAGELRFTPAGDLLHRDESSGTYQVREFETGRVRLDASLPNRKLDRVQFLPDGGFVAAVRDGSGATTLRVFIGGEPGTDGRVVAEVGPLLRSYVYFPNGRWVVTEDPHGQGVSVHDGATGRFLYFHNLPGDQRGFSSALLPLPERDTVLVGRLNGVTPLKLGRQGAEPGPLIPTGAVWSLCRSQDGRFIDATGHSDGVWRFGYPDPKPEQLPRAARPVPPEGYGRWTTSLDRRWEVWAEYRGTARVVAAATGRTAFEYGGLRPVARLEPGPGGRVEVRDGDVVQEYDTATGRRVAERRESFPPLGPGERPCGVSGDERLLAVHKETPPVSRVSVREVATGRELWAADQDVSGGWPRFDRTGRTVVVTGNARTTWHEAESGRVLAELPGWCNPSPDGRLAVSYLGFGRRQVYELKTGEVRVTLANVPAPDGQDAIGTPHFSADGRFLAGFGPVCGAVVWSLADGSTAYTANEPRPNGGSPAGDISADGRWLAWTDRDRVRVREWAVPRGRTRDVWLAGHVGPVNHVAFTPDGKYLLTGGHDGTILVWDVARFERRSRVTADRTDADDLWSELGSLEAGAAAKAVAALAARPDAAVRLARRHLPAVTVPSSLRLAALVADLGSDDPPARDRAEAELGRLADTATGALRWAVRSDVPERRRRAERLLARLDGPVRDPARLLALRAVEVVERAGTPDARELLAAWATGAETALLTREAKAALARLADR